MSAKPKPQSTGIDHVRDTLTGVINIVGETRQDIKKIEHKMDARFDQQDKEIFEIKEMLKALLSR